jgi:hypothetical protein
MRSSRLLASVGLLGLGQLFVTVQPADARSTRQGRATYARGFPAALYGGAFLTGNYGHFRQGYAARYQDGTPVFYYTKPLPYRFTVDGVQPRSQWHRWHELR